MLVESGLAYNGFFVVSFGLENFLSHVDIGAHIVEVFHLLLTIVDTFRSNHIIVPPAPSMIVLAWGQQKFYPLVLIFMAFSPDFKLLAQFVPIEAEEATFWILEHGVEDFLGVVGSIRHFSEVLFRAHMII